jgi:hypothetical protein
MEEKQKTKWKPTDNRFVAFIDILGFKDLVMRSTHKAIYDMLNKISKEKKRLENLNTDIDLLKLIGNGEIYTVSFSDSIVLFSKNDDGENFRLFLVAVRWLFATSIENNIPMKGGIAHGKISLNKSEQIYFGQPIIDAYMIEEEVNYLGITAHNSIDKYIYDNSQHLDMKHINELLFECPTPMKSGRIVHTNINWFKQLEIFNINAYEHRGIDYYNDIFKKIRLSTSGSPRRYVDNTIEVLNTLNCTNKAQQHT